ncbi:hypothetical protein BDZ97DRAFT_1760873 [Flammula alnicola]|nr:hypothetical protein BDZ97DRAFT_1760873 [Flammula alnicola]
MTRGSEQIIDSLNPYILRELRPLNRPLVEVGRVASALVQKCNAWASARFYLTSYGQDLHGLTPLPLELLTEILKALEWQDVLNVGQTCKRLSEASRARPIWADIVNRHMQPADPGALPLERPIAMYTAEELEHVFLRWKSSEIAWTAEDRFPRERDLKIEKPLRMCLVKGGRWLLIATPAGTLDYMDLDAPVLVQVPLIPNPFNGEDKFIMQVKMSPDYSQTSPTDLLTFNIVLATTATVSPPTYDPTTLVLRSPAVHLLQVWCISLVLDHHQHATGLSAERLASFPQEPPDLLQSLSLLGSHIAYCWVRFDPLLSFPVVVDWTRAQELGANYPKHMISGVWCPKSIRLLPGHRVCLNDGLRLTIFDYLQVPERTTWPSRRDPMPAEPLCTSQEMESPNDHWKTLSEPFFSPSSTYMFFLNYRTFYALIIGGASGSGNRAHSELGDNQIRIMKLTDTNHTMLIPSIRKTVPPH